MTACNFNYIWIDLLFSANCDLLVHRERLWMTFDASVCAGFLFFLLITGCVLKNGSLTLCNSVTQAVPNITSCEEAQSKAWTAPFKGYLFYSSLQKAETTVWVSLFLWLMIGGLGLAQRRYSLTDPGVTAAETEPFFNWPNKEC
uniref:Transmembrane protein 179B n=1 Tax=Periophthalmus magnuspinnatus TaxID=409849 RepID=A0A3B3ZCL4_9GOBI